MKVILISGKAGSGKDTFSTMLKLKLERQNYKVLTLHFADLVKTYAYMYFNWNGEKNEAGRSLLQNIGNNTFRQFDANYWARITAECAAVMGKYFNYDFILIPDTRYPNEIQVVKQYNPEVYCYRINRFDEYGRRWINPNLTYEQRHNESEIALDDYQYFDAEIYNSNLETLNKLAIGLVKTLTENKN